MKNLGCINQWPGGYAMTLGTEPSGSVVRCCEGHETPEGAKRHGLARGVEIMLANADRDLAAWVAQEQPA